MRCRCPWDKSIPRSPTVVSKPCGKCKDELGGGEAETLLHLLFRSVRLGPAQVGPNRVVKEHGILGYVANVAAPGARGLRCEPPTPSSRTRPVTGKSWPVTRSAMVLFPAPDAADDGRYLSCRDGQRQLHPAPGAAAPHIGSQPARGGFPARGKAPFRLLPGASAFASAFAADGHQVFKGGQLAQEGLQLAMPRLHPVEG